MTAASLRGGYTQDQLEAAFRKVQNPAGWKLHVDATVDLTPEEVPVVEFAVPYFTGGEATLIPLGAGRYRVLAAGYYAEVGA